MSITLSQIRDAVANYTGVTLSDLMGPSRKSAITRPRQVAYKLARELTNATDGMIAHSLGRSDASTVQSGVQSLDVRGCAYQVEAYEKIKAKLIADDEFQMGGKFKSRRAQPVTFTTSRNTAAQALQ